MEYWRSTDNNFEMVKTVFKGKNSLKLVLNCTILTFTMASTQNYLFFFWSLWSKERRTKKSWRVLGSRLVWRVWQANCLLTIWDMHALTIRTFFTKQTPPLSQLNTSSHFHCSAPSACCDRRADYWWQVRRLSKREELNASDSRLRAHEWGRGAVDSIVVSLFTAML